MTPEEYARLQQQKIFSDRVRSYRRKHEYSIHEAKEAIRNMDFLDAIENAKTVEDLKPILRHLIMQKLSK